MYFFVIGGDAQEEQIGGETREAVLEIGSRTEPLGLGVYGVDARDHLLELGRVYLALKLVGQLRLELHSDAFAVVALYEHFGAR